MFGCLFKIVLVYWFRVVVFVRNKGLDVVYKMLMMWMVNLLSRKWIKLLIVEFIILGMIKDKLFVYIFRMKIK